MQAGAVGEEGPLEQLVEGSGFGAGHRGTAYTLERDWGVSAP